MLLEPRFVKLSTRTGIEVRRTLPNAKKRMIGAWAFVDHFGPTTQTDGMVVAAHPHTGLQTATWLFEGRIEHRDSIGTAQFVEPGQLNLMTAGRGIAHSELSQADSASLHAVQLWIALPDSVRKMAPEFEQQTDLPRVSIGGISGTVFVGAMHGQPEARAQTKIYSPMVGAELRIPAGEFDVIELDPKFEHGFLVAIGSVQVAGLEVPMNSMEYFEPGTTSVTIKNTGDEEATVILLGGEPFEEPIVMWWNFIERTHDEIVAVREKWNNRDASIPGFVDHIGGWIPAPELPNLILRARNN